MVRNDRVEARKLMAHLGWVEELPMLKKPEIIPSAITVPVQILDATDLSSESVREGDCSGRGLHKMDFPRVSPELPSNTHPYEWALREVAGLDSRWGIDYAQELPVMPVPDAVDSLRIAISVRDESLKERVLLIRAVYDAGAGIEEVADSLNLSVASIYQYLQKSQPGAGEGLPDSLAALHLHYDAVAQASQRREELIIYLLDAGVVSATVARFAGVSRPIIKKIYDRHLGQ